MKKLLILLTVAFAFASCDDPIVPGLVPNPNPNPDENTEQTPGENQEETPEETPEDKPEVNPAPVINDPGIAYMWDESVIPEITVKITEEEWNRLLKRYDEFSGNVDYFYADFEYKKGSDVHHIED